LNKNILIVNHYDGRRGKIKVAKMSSCTSRLPTLMIFDLERGENKGRNFEKEKSSGRRKFKVLRDVYI